MDYKKKKFDLKSFLTEPEPEFVICDICKNNRKGMCLRSVTAGESESPPEMYYNICKEFSPPMSPIDPHKFAELMTTMVERTPCEPSVTFAETMQERRYNMEYLLCVMLEMLGYGEGAKIFLDQGFECPF